MMNANSVAQLNGLFSFQGANHHLSFKMGEGNIPVVEVQNEHATAAISLQGAHLLSWVPVGQDDVIWLSADASFSPGKSVRGGIPVCWPWFGAHATYKVYPAHGFARTVEWQVVRTEDLSSFETRITFHLDTTKLPQDIQEMWPQSTLLEYRLTIGKTLTLELATSNNSDQVMVVGQALHTYFNVSDVTSTIVYGLEGKDYLDKPDSFKRKTQVDAITIDNEVDRVYLQTPDDIIIDNQKRKIIINKQGSHTTIVWNPWDEVANKMGDLGKEGYLNMLCVESANAADDTVSIEPGEQHQLRVVYSLE